MFFASDFFFSTSTFSSSVLNFFFIKVWSDILVSRAKKWLLDPQKSIFLILSTFCEVLRNRSCFFKFHSFWSKSGSKKWLFWTRKSELKTLRFWGDKKWLFWHRKVNNFLMECEIINYQVCGTFFLFYRIIFVLSLFLNFFDILFYFLYFRHILRIYNIFS